MESLFDQVSKGIREAMKARDKVRLEALRNIKKVFIEAKTAPGANDTLDDATAMKILQKARQARRRECRHLYKGQPSGTGRRRDGAGQSYQGIPAQAIVR